MTERLAEIESRLTSMRELSEIISAMRGLAAMRIQEAEHNLASTRAYAGIVRESLLRAMSMLPETPRAPAAHQRTSDGIVVFGAEHGLVGDFNGRVVVSLEKVSRALLFVIGARGMATCRERGLPVAWSCPMATHVNAITATARHISEELNRRFSRGEVNTIEIVVAQFAGGTQSIVTRRQVLPVEAQAKVVSNATPPLVNLRPMVLIESMLEEYLFAELVDAAMESFASENAARLATMQTARRNVEQKLDDLTIAARAVRQDEITAELLDIVIGAQAAAE